MNCGVAPLPSQFSLHYAWVWPTHTVTAGRPRRLTHILFRLILFLHEVIILYCMIWYCWTASGI